jgi:hypothetical protein
MTISVSGSGQVSTIRHKFFCIPGSSYPTASELTTRLSSPFFKLAENIFCFPTVQNRILNHLATVDFFDTQSLQYKLLITCATVTYIPTSLKWPFRQRFSKDGCAAQAQQQQKCSTIETLASFPLSLQLCKSLSPLNTLFATGFATDLFQIDTFANITLRLFVKL